jgi:hypothetical protein
MQNLVLVHACEVRLLPLRSLLLLVLSQLLESGVVF